LSYTRARENELTRRRGRLNRPAAFVPLP